MICWEDLSEFLEWLDEAHGASVGYWPTDRHDHIDDDIGPLTREEIEQFFEQWLRSRPPQVRKFYFDKESETVKSRLIQ